MSDHDPSHRAAEKAVDHDRLLPGEASDSDDPEDVRVWIAAYDELLAFKQRMLDDTRRLVANEMTNEPARQEIRETDLKVLEAETARFRRRLDFWQGRLSELARG